MKTRLTSFALALALLGALFMLPGSAIAQTANQVVDIPVAGKFPGGTFTGTLDILSFAVQNGQLVALGNLSGTLARRNGNVVGSVTNESVAIPVTDLVPSPGSCTILDLTLGPLDLTLLGLRVQLSQVDLLITGEPGGLLGDLLCALADLLSNNGPLDQIVNLLNQILAELLG